MENLFINETHVNETEGYGFGESGWYETFTNDIGQLYRSLRKEYGKPKNMYRDTPNGKPKKVGWVFTKKCKYEDTDEEYKLSVWVEVSRIEPIKKTVNIEHPF